MKRIFLMLLSSTLILTSCKRDNDNKGGVFNGPEVQVHDGKACTWIQQYT